MEAIIRIVLGLVIISIFILNFWSLAYLLGLIFWLFDSLFNYLAYLGASCSFIEWIQTAFYSACVLFVILWVVNLVKHA